MRKRLPSIWRDDHQNFRERKVIAALFYKVTSTMHIRKTKEKEEVAAHRRIYGNFHTKRIFLERRNLHGQANTWKERQDFMIF